MLSFQAITLIIATIASIGIPIAAAIRLEEPWKIDSVSNISYILGQDLFRVWIGSLGVLVAPAIMTALQTELQPVGLALIAGLWLVAATADYRDQNNTLHWIGGVLWLVSSVVVVAAVNWGALLLWVIYGIAMAASSKARYSFVFWGEMTAYMALLLALACPE